MRRMIRQVIEGARDEMLRFRRDMVEDRGMSEEELVQRYVTQHRGNVQALIEFARQSGPPEGNPLVEAVRYEQQLERLIKTRGG